MTPRPHFVINYEPDDIYPWVIYDTKNDVVVTAHTELDPAILQLRALRQELAMGDLA